MYNFPCNKPFVQRLSSKAMDTENCRYTLLQTKKQLRLYFRKIVLANQLSLYGAVANMCEECESLHDRSGQLVKVMDNQLCSVRSRQKFLWRMMNPAYQNFLLQRYEERIERLWQQDKVNFVWMQVFWVLLKFGSISWRQTLENNFMQWRVVNTLFQRYGSSQPEEWFLQMSNPRVKKLYCICSRTMKMIIKGRSPYHETCFQNPHSCFWLVVW